MDMEPFSTADWSRSGSGLDGDDIDSAKGLKADSMLILGRIGSSIELRPGELSAADSSLASSSEIDKLDDLFTSGPSYDCEARATLLLLLLAMINSCSAITSASALRTEQQCWLIAGGKRLASIKTESLSPIILLAVPGRYCGVEGD